MAEWTALVELFQPIGIAGLLCALLAYVWIRDRKRADTERDIARRLNDKVREQLIQLNKESNKVASEATSAIQAASAHIRMATEEYKSTSKENIQTLVELKQSIEKANAETNARIDKWILHRGTREL